MSKLNNELPTYLLRQRYFEKFGVKPSFGRKRILEKLDGASRAEIASGFKGGDGEDAPTSRDVHQQSGVVQPKKAKAGSGKRTGHPKHSGAETELSTSVDKPRDSHGVQGVSDFRARLTNSLHGDDDGALNDGHSAGSGPNASLRVMVSHDPSGQRLTAASDDKSEFIVEHGSSVTDLMCKIMSSSEESDPLIVDGKLIDPLFELNKLVCNDRVSNGIGRGAVLRIIVEEEADWDVYLVGLQILRNRLRGKVTYTELVAIVARYCEINNLIKV
jgi:hypothetical protein